jgi:hypothetical protein
LPRWDGTWSVVAFSAEADRDCCHLLRTRLRWLTFAPSPGLWIPPHPHLEEARTLAELGIDNKTLSASCRAARRGASLSMGPRVALARATALPALRPVQARLRAGWLAPSEAGDARG